MSGVFVLVGLTVIWGGHRRIQECNVGFFVVVVEMVLWFILHIAECTHGGVNAVIFRDFTKWCSLHCRFRTCSSPQGDSSHSCTVNLCSHRPPAPPSPSLCLFWTLCINGFIQSLGSCDRLLGPCVFLRLVRWPVLVAWSLSRLNSVPLYGCASFCLSVHQLTSI